MKMQRLRVGVLMAAAVMMAGTVAHARPGKGGEGKHGPPMLRPEMVDRLADKLGLEDQVARSLKELAYEAQEKAIELGAEVRQARLKLRRMLDSDNPDEGDVLDQVERVGELKTALKKHRVRLMLAVRRQLTPEQLRSLKQLMRKRHHKERGARGQRGMDRDDKGGGEERSYRRERSRERRR